MPRTHLHCDPPTKVGTKAQECEFKRHDARRDGDTALSGKKEEGVRGKKIRVIKARTKSRRIKSFRNESDDNVITSRWLAWLSLSSRAIISLIRSFLPFFVSANFNSTIAKY